MKTLGEQIDQQRQKIQLAIESCRKKIDDLTREGVQVGTIHFKTDRPNTMYILEPSVDGRRKYVHVGTDPEKQKIKREEVERWIHRDELQKAVESLEADLRDIDRLAEMLLTKTTYVSSIASKAANG
ncbi:hypothetical protein [Methylophaga nitratireducenticrescens]|uniref:hypothetical protein n=1 Tax=Methylophaga nitratireducenticrescens TaxID=754476 RepID=UPI000CDCA3D4|nr:hypothetical protein [Methylophaga nitratireducenticrescens]AUZ86176.1 hypothetical protein CDW43_16100 [Methylophaga nitratireducenticrescens]